MTQKTKKIGAVKVIKNGKKLMFSIPSSYSGKDFTAWKKRNKELISNFKK